MRSMIVKAAAVTTLAVFVPFVSGCEKRTESEPSKEKETESAPSSKPAVEDAKLANAMAAATKEAPAAAGEVNGPANGPPQNGVMTLAQADAELARNRPSVLTLGAQGTPPLIKLGPAHLAPRAVGSLEVSVRTGSRSALPTIVFELETTSKDSEVTGQVSTTLKVRKASLSADQPGRLPDGLETQVAKLQGSTFSTLGSANGANTGVTHKVSAGGEDFEAVLDAASELLQSVVVPYPDQPVGVGGYWMVKSRELFHGSDVVVYRLTKVTEVNGQQAKLSLQTRRYAVGSSLAMSGLPPHSLLQFDGAGQGQLVISTGVAFPEQGQITDTLNAMIAQNGNPQQTAPIQLVAEGLVAFDKH